ncbi:MAG: hypothetical protein ACTHN4_08610 [Sphingomicrobium sp.]
MKLGALARAYVIYGALLLVICFVALPRSDELTGFSDSPQNLPFIEGIIGTANGPFESRDILFDKFDCELGSSRVSYQKSPEPAPGSLAARYNLASHEPYYVVTCEGHERRGEILFCFFAALFFPLVGYLAFQWVKRGQINKTDSEPVA